MIEINGIYVYDQCEVDAKLAELEAKITHNITDAVSIIAKYMEQQPQAPQ